MKSWQRYPEYQDSGVEWLGEIPKHWEVKRLRFCIRVNPIKSEIAHLPKNTKVSFLPMENIGRNGTLNLEKTELLEKLWNNYTFFQNNDVIVAKITSCFENGKGALCKCLVNGIGFGTTELHVLRSSKDVEPKFLFYLTKTSIFILLGVSEMTGVAGQQRVPENFIKNYRVAIPPLPEQKSIAHFLDQETSKLDNLIAKKQRFIELLQEKRTALISHAVTKGLNPDVPMKDSGVEWLGQIPKHWEVKKLKYLITEPLKYGANESAELNNKDCPRFIRITDISEDGTLREETFRSLPHDIAKPFILKAGDILFARSGATVGKTFMYSEHWGIACHAGYLIRARLKTSKAIPEFISYFANSSVYWDWISSIFIQATIQNVSAEKYANLSLAIPPLSEQKAIAHFLDQETSKIDTIIAKTKTSIEKLKEYRTALISAAVTGKIDIREEVA